MEELQIFDFDAPASRRNRRLRQAKTAISLQLSVDVPPAFDSSKENSTSGETEKFSILTRTDSEKPQMDTPSTLKGDLSSASDLTVTGLKTSLFSDSRCSLRQSLASSTIFQEEPDSCPNMNLLHAAAFMPVDQALRQLEAADTDQLNASFNSNLSILMTAASRQSAHLVKAIIGKIKTQNLNSVNGSGQAAIHIAVIAGVNESLKALIEAGADVNIQDKTGRTPLHYASIKGRSDLCMLLVEAGAELGLNDIFGLIPQAYATDKQLKANLKTPEFTSPAAECAQEQASDSKRVADRRRTLLYKLGIRQQQQAETRVVNRFEFTENVTKASEPARRLRSQKEVIENRQRFCLQPVACPPSVDDFDLIDTVDAKSSQQRLYRCSFKASGREVVAKEYIKRQLLSDCLPTQAELEKRVLTNFEHPYISKLVASFQTEKRLYQILDVQAQSTLQCIIDGQGKLSLNQSRVLAAEVALVLDALHSKGLVCRRLAPESILIDKEGHISMSDFLLARPINETSLSQSDLSLIDDALPPEMRNVAAKGKSFDWYALAHLLLKVVDYSNKTTNISDNEQKSQSTEQNEVGGNPQFLAFVDLLLKQASLAGQECKFGLEDIAKADFYLGFDWNKVVGRKYSIFASSTLPRFTTKTTPSLLAEGDSLRPGKHEVPSWSSRHITVQ